MPQTKSNFQPILFVIISDRWSLLEKNAFARALNSHNSGEKVLIYTLRDSYVHTKAKELGLQTIYHKRSVHTGLFSWAKRSGLEHIIKKHKIKTIHCFQIIYLWKLCLFLRKFPQVAFFYSWFRPTRKSYRNIIYRLLSRRIDGVFVAFKDQVKTCTTRFEIPLRKIHVLGIPYLNMEAEVEDFDFKQTHFHGPSNIEDRDFLISLFFEQNIEDLDDYKEVFMGLRDALKSLSEKLSIGLVIASNSKWQERVLFKPLQGFLADNSFPLDCLYFYQGPSVLGLVQDSDLYIDIGTESVGYSEQGLMALKLGTPSLLPRSNFSIRLLSQKARIGETYRFHNAFEIRRMVTQVVENIKTYRKNLAKSEKRFSQSFCSEVDVSELYERTRAKRQRLFGK